MNEISSLSNQLIKEIKSLHSKKGRDKFDSFLVEGSKLVKEAINDKLDIEFIAIRSGCNLDIDSFEGKNIDYSLSEPVFKKVCTTENPTDIIAVVKKVESNFEKLFKEPSSEKLFVILDEVKDPGNLGTIIRTACAAFADAVILTDNSVDKFNPKVIRASAGTMWKIPVVYCDNKNKLIEKLKNNSFLIYSTDANTTDTYYTASYKGNIALIFGTEGTGISKIFSEMSDKTIKIPINTKVESLNVASSVSAILFEALRQRGKD